MPSPTELAMHEMWCGPDASGTPLWHVLTADKISTLCGVEKREKLRLRNPIDAHCHPCMRTFQAVLESP
jgi:hypothetical protein